MSNRAIHLHSGPDAYALPSVAEMQAFDAQCIESGTPSEELMERAGEGCARAIIEFAQERGLKKPRILVFCGPGNNGGDGLVLSRLLLEQGFEIELFIAQSERYSQDFLRKVRPLGASGACLLSLGSPEKRGGEDSQDQSFFRLRSCSLAELSERAEKADIFVDALLGTGQSGAPRGSIAEILLFQEVFSEKLRVAIDVPSGLDAQGSEVFSPCFQADLTIAIQNVKRGLMAYPARSFLGEIRSIDIGIPCRPLPFFSLLLPEQRPNFPERSMNTHKGKEGRVLVLGGSENMPGAPLLSSLGALFAGAGIVTQALPRGLKMYDCPPELLFWHVGEEADRCFASAHVAELPLRQSEALVIGPGLGSGLGSGAGSGGKSEEFLQTLLPLLGEKAKVLDADALNILARMPSRPRLSSSTVLTPHPGEAARLLSCSPEEVQADRFGAVQAMLEQFETATVVLKGASSIVACKDAGVLCPLGNPFLACPGSGDVLSGVIACFLAKGMPAYEAACLGVLLHARAGDLAFGEARGPFLATHLAQSLAGAYASLQDGRAR